MIVVTGYVLVVEETSVTIAMSNRTAATIDGLSPAQAKEFRAHLDALVMATVLHSDGTHVTIATLDEKGWLSKCVR